MNIEILKDLKSKLIKKFDLYHHDFLFIDLDEDVFTINWIQYNDKYINYDKDVYPLVEYSKKFLKKHNQIGYFYDAIYMHKV